MCYLSYTKFIPTEEEEQFPFQTKTSVAQQIHNRSIALRYSDVPHTSNFY